MLTVEFDYYLFAKSQEQLNEVLFHAPKIALFNLHSQLKMRLTAGNC